MAKPKLRFMYDDEVSKEGVGLTASQTATGYNVNNLAHPFVGKKWATNSLSESVIEINFGAPVTIDAIYIVNSNSRLATTEIITVYAHTAPQGLTKAAWDATNSYAHFGTFEDGPNYYQYPASPQTYQYWAIAHEHTGHPESALEISRLMMGQYLEFDKQMTENIVDSYNSLEKKQVTELGQVLGSIINFKRVLEFPFSKHTFEDRQRTHDMFKAVRSIIPVFMHLTEATSVFGPDMATLYGNFTAPTIRDFFALARTLKLSNKKFALEEAV